jgi:uncharacterized protein YegJ (DUF2314 family)
VLGKIIVGVPGPWSGPGELMAAILEANERTSETYLPLPGRIVHPHSGATFELDPYDRNPDLAAAFEAAGQGKLPPETLAAVDAHQSTAYVLSDGQSPDAARSMLALVDHLLEAGGVAVKVESSGVAHTAERWRHFARARRETTALYDAFVVLVGGEEFFYSCGMHNLGLTDASVAAEVGLQAGAEVLSAFNHRQLFGGPVLAEPFQVAFGEPAFSCELQPFGYDPEDPLNNPHGRWHLAPARDGVAPAGVFDRSPGDDPLFVALDPDDPEVQATVAQARATLHRFVEKHRSPYEYGVFLFKARFPAEPPYYLWLALSEARDDVLVGEVFEVPGDAPGPAPGQDVVVPRAEVFDWSIRRSSTLLGGFSRRLQRRNLGEERQLAFDLYSGIVAYAPTEELGEEGPR